MNQHLIQVTINTIADRYIAAIQSIEKICRDSIKIASENQRADFIAVLALHPAEENQAKAVQEAKRLYSSGQDNENTVELNLALTKARENYGLALKERDQALADLRAQNADGYGKEIAIAEKAEARAIALVDDAFSKYASAASVAVIEVALKHALDEVAVLQVDS